MPNSLPCVATLPVSTHRAMLRWEGVMPERRLCVLVDPLATFGDLFEEG